MCISLALSINFSLRWVGSLLTVHLPNVALLNKSLKNAQISERVNKQASLQGDQYVITGPESTSRHTVNIKTHTLCF